MARKKKSPDPLMRSPAAGCLPFPAAGYLPFAAASGTGAVETIHADENAWLRQLEASVHAEVLLPADAHVIGEPVTVQAIRCAGLARAGFLATCRRGDRTYELSLADVVFPARSAGASLVARYRTWLGLPPFVAPSVEEPARTRSRPTTSP